MIIALGDAILGLAEKAEQDDHLFLSRLLKISALEAYECSAVLNEWRTKIPVVGLWDWDVPNNIRHLDPTAANLFGYERKGHDSFSQDQITQRMHPDDIALWSKKVHEVASKGGIYEHEYRVIRNGRIRWLYAKGQCILDKSGRPQRFPGAIMDITVEKKLALAA